MGTDGKSAHSWRILLLPFLDGQELLESYSFDEPWDGPNNQKLASQMPRFFSFAGSHVSGESVSTNFVAVTGPETVWPPSGSTSYLDVSDPHSRTIQFAEYNGPPIHWMSPVDLPFAKMSFKVGDPAGVDSQYLDPAVAMVDGSVQRLSSSDVTEDEMRAMCTKSGGDGAPVPAHIQEMEDARLRQLKEAEVNKETSK